MAGSSITPLVITGLTATGKTSLALKLAAQFPIELISADARQVYNQMDIGTGKIGVGDTLEKKADQTWYLNNVPIHGINLINPNEVFSSMQFAAYAQQKITEISQRGNLPIIVGGTAFYLTSLFQPANDQYVPPNQELRAKWQQQQTSLTQADFVQSLQVELKIINAERFNQMNDSDRFNPRRLMRAIEIATPRRRHPERLAKDLIVENIAQNDITSSPFTALRPAIWISLHAPLDYLEPKITQRVHQMLSLGLESEVTDLLSTYTWNDPGLQTIGYYEWQPFFENKCSREEVVKQIILHNRQYARKQHTFLKRLPFVQWFDISDPTQLAQCFQTCKTSLSEFIN